MESTLKVFNFKGKGLVHCLLTALDQKGFIVVKLKVQTGSFY